MPFQIGHKIIGKIGEAHAGYQATIINIDHTYGELHIRIDRVPTYHVQAAGVRMWVLQYLWELDPAYVESNYFDVKPCRFCGKSNHVGIERCWNCVSIRPHLEL